jgi:hypothetical protein
MNLACGDLDAQDQSNDQSCFRNGCRSHKASLDGSESCATGKCGGD